MVHLDPTTLHVHSSAVPPWQTETTFQDEMAERLRRAPWLGLSAFVGAGLVFAGVTDTCGMGLMLARMPWNQIKEPTNPCCAKKGACS